MAMRIAVILRPVAHPGDDLSFNDDGTALDMEWTDVKANEFDEQASEEAILLADATGAEVVAVALGVEGADRMLRTALARGASRAVRVAWDGQYAPDSATAAPILAEAVRKLDVDLLLVGVQAADDATGPLTGRLAALLDWPWAGSVAGVEIVEGKVLARQEYAGGHAAWLSLSVPAVLGIHSASQPIRYVSGSRMGAAMKMQIDAMTSVETAPSTTVRPLSLATRDVQGRAAMVEGTPEAMALQLRDLLTARGLWPA